MQFYVGQNYTWGSFTYNDSLALDFQKIQKKQGRWADVRKLANILDDVVKRRAANGFPFFEVNLIPEISDDTIINLTFEATGFNEPIIIDTLVIPQGTRLKVGYLHKYLGIKNGELFNFTLISSIDQKLARLGFVTQKAPIISRFSTQGAILELPIEAKTTGSFGGMLGFTTTEVDDKLKITGDVHLKLQNAFRTGESVNLMWKKTASESQSLLAKAELPYIFNSPLGFYSSVDIQKIDTTLLLTNNEFLGIFHLTGLNQFRAGINYLSNRFLASFDSSEYDTKTVLYKAGFIVNNIDNSFNPSKGVESEFKIGIGNRESKDSLSGKDLIYNLYGRYVQFFKLEQKHILMVSAEGGAIVSGARLWPGEMFRIGGMYSMRGFDEQSMFASQYGFVTLEYRYRFERRSNAFVFTQAGDYRMNSMTENYSSSLFSAGAGAILDTGAGVFSIAYALGKSNQQPLKFRTAKIHFGYLVSF
jgi:outer membrane protein assembly factor BamA